MAQTDEVPAKKKKSKLKWIILLFLIIVLGGGGFTAYKLGLTPSLGGLLGDGEAEQSGGGEATASTGGSTRITTPTSNLRTATFDPFVANLSDLTGNRYVRMTIDVEVISQEVLNELASQNPRIRDAMIMLLSSKSYNDLSSQAGKLQLKNEILDRINQVLGAPKVTRVFFTDLVVQ